MQQWRDTGYLSSGNDALAERFMTEARGAQQVRLKHDQQVPIWDSKL
jgi:hypothetical protein